MQIYESKPYKKIPVLLRKRGVLLSDCLVHFARGDNPEILLHIYNLKKNATSKARLYLLCNKVFPVPLPTNGENLSQPCNHNPPVISTIIFARLIDPVYL
jgi:hypothetical protein